jgi:hypothetical protein
LTPKHIGDIVTSPICFGGISKAKRSPLISDFGQAAAAAAAIQLHGVTNTKQG